MNDTDVQQPKRSPLAPEALYRTSPTESLDFETTDDLEPLAEVLGQDRAVAAIQFAIGIRHDGYNLFALGPGGTGKRETVQQFLEQHAKEKPTPPDWCYVNNFDDPEKPRVLELPAGTGSMLRSDMEKFVEDLTVAIPAAFEADDYQRRRQAIQEEFKEQQQTSFSDLEDFAETLDLVIMRTPVGLVFLPKRDGEVLSPDDIAQLPEEERKQIQDDIEKLQEKVRDTLKHQPRWEKDQRGRVRDLNREVTAFVVADSIRALRERYQDLPSVLAFLKAVEEDIVENVDDFLERIQSHDKSGQGGGEGGPLGILRAAMRGGDVFNAYKVNMLVDNSDAEGAPVIYQDNPTLANLVGRVAKKSQFGLLMTDFSLVRPGALHQANHGYLMLDAIKVLRQPFAWDELKRCLRAKAIRIESAREILDIGATVSLEPEPIDLDIRVVLLGDRWLYYLLSALDPEFSELFKVGADFETDMDREVDQLVPYARMLASRIREDGLRPFDRSAMSRVIERSARLADDAEKLSTHRDSIVDLLREADYWAGQNGHDLVTRADVQKAIDSQIYRDSRVRERILEEIERGRLLIATEGEEVGQINGMAVLSIGGYRFGKASRITARIRPGKGDVVDIEREVELGGPIHSKGVMILTGFLGSRYAPDRPLALSASLVFEQSYGGVDGDSASLAELCALLSAVGQVPIRQSFAVTGSVNQHGQVQAVGGLNEKIEGFFDVCKARGLDGRQGAILPASNVSNLMLREDVVAAAEEGLFNVYAVKTVDEAIELLTGRPSGERDDDDAYPEGTVNRAIDDRLSELAELARKFARGPKAAGEET